MNAKQEPRGVRNNNPGNLDRGAIVWRGEDRSAAALASEKRFCVFETPQAGFRALARTLLTYQNKHGLRTVREMINRWAPPVENNTEAYIAQVAREVGVGSREIVSLSKQVPLQRMVTAIARHENGGLFWDEAVIEAGVRQALA
ncbi:structural protein P5 [Stenotrophomonas sp.]|uniref:structural protein P5 n=1 Tax=Stenotrophomonas sp. TaxID=69392 RepID=UPI0028AF04CB|nr:structural protein P5 [Stenotrophomonas sp.]